MINLVFLVFLLILSSAYSQERGGENTGERNTENSSSATEIEIPGMGQLNQWSGELNNMALDSQTFQNRNIFRPLLEINTNRGSLKTKYSIPFPPNLLNIKLLTFVYNHRQTSNLGYGVGWDVALPFLERKREQGRDVVVLRNIKGAGVYILSRCFNFQAVKCFRASIDTDFYEILQLQDKSFSLKTRSHINYRFNSDGSLKYIQDIRENKIQFKYEKGVLSQIYSNKNSWTLTFSYSGKQDYPFYRFQSFYYLPSRLKSVMVRSGRKVKQLLFDYDNNYLTKAYWSKSQKSLFRGKYNNIESITSESLVLPSPTKKQKYVIKKNSSVPELESIESDANTILFIDINGDGRQEKLILHTKEWRERVSKLLNSLKYSTVGNRADNCEATPEKSMSSVKESLDAIPVKTEVHWAFLKNDVFQYKKDTILSSLSLPLFNFDLTKKRRRTKNCDNVYYYETKPYLKNILVGDFDFDDVNDILVCPHSRFQEKSLSDLLVKALKHEKVKFSAVGTSTLVDIQLDYNLLREMDSTDLQDVNVVPDSHSFKLAPGPLCGGDTIASDFNKDGYIDLFHGDSIQFNSPVNSITTSFNDPSIHFNDLSLNSSSPRLLVQEGDRFSIVNATHVVSTQHGTFLGEKNKTQFYRPGSNTKLLTSYQGDFGGEYLISYILKDKTTLVSKIKKQDKDKELHNVSTYEYSESSRDKLTGVFVGYSKTVETERSLARKNPLVTRREFTKDARADIIHLANRGRVQGQLISKTEYDPITKKGHRKKILWDGIKLSENRLYLFPHTINNEKFEGEVFSVSTIQNSTADWYLGGDELIFPRVEKVRKTISDDLLNFFENEKEESLVKTYNLSSLGNRLLVSKVKTEGEVEDIVDINYNSLDELEQVIHNSKYVKYDHDNLGRIISLNDNFAEDFVIKYEGNRPYPKKIIKDEISFLIKTDPLTGHQLEIQSELGHYKSLYDSEGLVRKIIAVRDSKEVTVFESFPFNEKDNFLKPQYQVINNGVLSLIKLDDFGNTTYIESQKRGEEIISVDREVVDGKVINEYTPYSKSNPRRIQYEFSYNSFGQKINSKRISTSPLLEKFSFNHGCKSHDINGFNVSIDCFDASGKVVSSSYFKQDVKFNWHNTQSIKKLSNGILWSYNDEQQPISFSFNNNTFYRNIQKDGKEISFGGLKYNFDDDGKLVRAKLNEIEMETTFLGSKVKSQDYFYNGFNLFKTNYDYKQNKIERVRNNFYDLQYSYDQYQNLKKEVINIKGNKKQLNYHYVDGDLSEIQPYIEKLEYYPNGKLKSVYFKNGLFLNIILDKNSSTLRSLSYKAGSETIFKSLTNYNFLEQVKSHRILKPEFAKKLSRNFTYNDFKLSISKPKEQIKENNGYIDSTSRFHSLEHCGEFLCNYSEGDNSFNIIYDPLGGLKGGSSIGLSGDFSPYRKGEFLLVSKNKAIIEGNYVQLISVDDYPLGVIINNTFYPVITNFKKELIGVVSEDAQELLYLRNFSMWGSKELLIPDDRLTKEAQHIDKLLIWGVGRLIHNPLEARMNQEFYFSNSRAYSVSAQRWTAPDPLLMWGPKSLVGTYGNWHPYLYCHDNPINFVDPSGYASFSVNYSNRSRVNGTFITKGVKTATSFAIGAAYNNAARTSFGLGVGAGELVKNNFRLAALGGTVAGSVGATALNMGVKTVLVGTAFTVGQKIGNVFGAAIDTLVDNAQGSANDFFSKMMNSTGATDVLYDVGFGSGSPNFDFQDHNSSPSSDFWNSNPYSTDN